ncbi:helix-turn-helix domain-containing protein [Flavobacterium rakeshii]|uniref:Helix-turn-helix domain-containing protein n=1 Tax=Flavobacterium rakeshii TaxID=1038845 RepID=A0A6N8HF49_9FLAO|nr:helix-turn-helix transcriptional regulator [Flavobacterium rakeshii]MEE1898664.1 helix-turn-helix transcriptional regulator [Flavobacterium rakeshii]MUV04344.1 helix-turn-helix domain-containing protein [Flavobacterium rakeshii]
MINTDDFIKRLENILDYYNISASVFADKIGVQRSSLSHLLSGRNKPSLDFVLRVTDNFPDVDLYWLLNGKGTFPKSETPAPEINIPSPSPVYIEQQTENNNVGDLFSEKTETDVPQSENKEFEEKNNFEENTEAVSQAPGKTETPANPTPPIDTIVNYNSDVEQVVIFYKDGTFKNYKPRK